MPPLFMGFCFTLFAFNLIFFFIPLYLSKTTDGVGLKGKTLKNPSAVYAVEGSKRRIIRQGFPAAKTLSGMSRVTTLPAPITLRLPMRTPGQTMAPPPIHTSSPISMGFADSQPSVLVVTIVAVPLPLTAQGSLRCPVSSQYACRHVPC